MVVWHTWISPRNHTISYQNLYNPLLGSPPLHGLTAPAATMAIDNSSSNSLQHNSNNSQFLPKPTNPNDYSSSQWGGQRALLLMLQCTFYVDRRPHTSTLNSCNPSWDRWLQNSSLRCSKFLHSKFSEIWFILPAKHSCTCTFLQTPRKQNISFLALSLSSKK